jgi:hypothetical protein
MLSSEGIIYIQGYPVFYDFMDEKKSITVGMLNYFGVT